MASGAKSSSKPKGRKGKIGKKKGQMLAYLNGKRHEKSHIRRILAHLKRYGAGDKVAAEALMRYRTLVGVY